MINLTQYKIDAYSFDKFMLMKKVPAKKQLLNSERKTEIKSQKIASSNETPKSTMRSKTLKNTNVKLPNVKRVNETQQKAYILKQILGEGAFAKVRLGVRKSDNLLCAIKIYEKCKLYSQQKKKSLRKEISILEKISHPGIIKIIQTYETSQTINIVMEHFSNQSLALYTKQKRNLSQEELKNIVKTIAQALSYLHSNKIFHRDIKPQNVLINSEGKIKLIDLGLAMIGDHKEMIVAGTPQFMCPELLNKRHYCPYKADIWAFGILVYWLVLGYYPQDNHKHSRRKTINFDLSFPIDMHPGIQYLIEKMLHIDPENRITAEEILQNSWIKPLNFKLQIAKLSKNML